MLHGNKLSYTLFGSAQGGNQINRGRRAPWSLAPSKCDTPTIRRPGREPVGGRIRGQAERLLRIEYFDIDVVIVLVLAIPGESHLAAIG